MTQRIFFKLLGAFLLVIAVATATVDFAVRRAGETSLRHLLFAFGLAFLVAVVLAALISRAISRRLQRIVLFAEQIAAGDLTARLEEASGDEIAHVAATLDRT